GLAGVRGLRRVAGGRPGAAGRPPDDAPRPARPGARAARHAPCHGRGRRADGGPSRRLRRPETSTRGGDADGERQEHAEGDEEAEEEEKVASDGPTAPAQL